MSGRKHAVAVVCAAGRGVATGGVDSRPDEPGAGWFGYHPRTPQGEGVPATRVGERPRTRRRRRPAVEALVAAFGRILGTRPLKVSKTSMDEF